MVEAIRDLAMGLGLAILWVGAICLMAGGIIAALALWPQLGRAGWGMRSEPLTARELADRITVGPHGIEGPTVTDVIERAETEAGQAWARRLG